MKSNEKRKYPLALMELLVMILVFALAASASLQAFAHANRLSHRQEAKVHGILAAQNAAELLKSTHGDYKAVIKTLGGHPDEKGNYIISDMEWNEQTAWCLQITPLADTDPYLASATICGFYNSEILFEITVAWQEVQHEKT